MFIIMNQSAQSNTPANISVSQSLQGQLTVNDWQVITDIIDNPFLSLAEREQVLLQHGLMVIRV